MQGRSISIVAFGSVAMMMIGCGELTFVNGSVHVTVNLEDAVVSPDEPAALVVTARNVGDERIVRGMGSSSCQLGLEVRVAGAHVQGVPLRLCTEDLVAQGLEPGETRTERLEWGGSVVGPDQTVTPLPPGEYDVRGAAGEAFVSARVRITVAGSTLQSR